MASRPQSRGRSRGAARGGESGSGAGRRHGGFWALLLLLAAIVSWYSLARPSWNRFWGGVSDRLLAWTRGAGSTPEREAPRIPGCGIERWAVKTLADPDAGRVNMTPVATTVTALRHIPRPAESAIPEDGRNPIEEHVYRVHALLLRYKRESDEDIHLVIADPSNPRATMVAEIPAGRCTENRQDSPLFSELQEDLNNHFGEAPDRYFRRLRHPVHVTITGVGFFDFLHGQSGMAPNGLELHPVLDWRAY